MTANEIFTLEQANTNTIYLSLAGHFWQAWERSAYFFTHYLEKYAVHGRFIKKIGVEMVYLGFSKEAMAGVLKKASLQKFIVQKIDEQHITITGFSPLLKFNEWKNKVYSESIAKSTSTKPSLFENTDLESSKNVPITEQTAISSNVPKISHTSLLFAYKEFYECVRYIFTKTGEADRLYRYGLGDKLRSESLDLLDVINLALMGASQFDGLVTFGLFCRIRIKIRLLLDFRQMTQKQWFFINEKLEKVKEVLRLESFGLRFKGVC